jgi:acyl carrier protein
MSISEAVRNYILENYLFSDDPSALADDESFMEKGIVDSTGMMEVISFLEEEFDLSVQDEEMVPENLDSVSAIVAYVQRKQAQQTARQTSAG